MIFLFTISQSYKLTVKSEVIKLYNVLFSCPVIGACSLRVQTPALPPDGATVVGGHSVKCVSENPSIYYF